MDAMEPSRAIESPPAQPLRFAPSPVESSNGLVHRIESVSRISFNTWNFEERELLKKALLTFGFNRWEKIRLCFEKQKDLGLRVMSLEDIRAYSNTLIRSIADNLNYQNFDLKVLLLSMLNSQHQLTAEPREDDALLRRDNDSSATFKIEVLQRVKRTGQGLSGHGDSPGLPESAVQGQAQLDWASGGQQGGALRSQPTLGLTPLETACHQPPRAPQDLIICVNSRDWDLNSIRQRAKPWAKRLQIMHHEIALLIIEPKVRVLSVRRESTTLDLKKRMERDALLSRFEPEIASERITVFSGNVMNGINFYLNKNTDTGLIAMIARDSGNLIQKHYTREMASHTQFPLLVLHDA